MAAKKTNPVIGYEIRVKTNPAFCGIGAGGVQFAYGKARLSGGRMVDWFREHDGYEVIELTAGESAQKEKASAETE